MDPELLKKILAQIAAGGDESGILQEIVASVAADEEAEETGGTPVADAADPATPPPAGAKPGAPVPPKKDPPVPPTMNAEAFAAELVKLTGAADAATAIKLFGEIGTMRTRLQTLEADALASEVEQRADLVAELVVLEVELPATAWEGDPDKRIPVKRLSAEPIKDLEKRVAAFRAARPERARKEFEPPTEAEQDITALSDSELEACKARNLDPKVYLRRKANAVRRSE